MCLAHLTLGSGGWIRTNDLWVMSPTSFHCSTPRCSFYKGRTLSLILDKFSEFLHWNCCHCLIADIASVGFSGQNIHRSFDVGSFKED